MTAWIGRLGSRRLRAARYPLQHKIGSTPESAGGADCRQGSHRGPLAGGDGLCSGQRERNNRCGDRRALRTRSCSRSRIDGTRGGPVCAAPRRNTEQDVPGAVACAGRPWRPLCAAPLLSEGRFSCSLRRDAQARSGWQAYSEELDGIDVQIRRFHRKLVWLDLTPAGAGLDQGRTPLYVVPRARPGLVPISFGYGLEPLGLPEAQRLVRRNRKHALRRSSPFPHPYR